MPRNRRPEPQIAWPLKVLAVLAVGGAVLAGFRAVQNPGEEDAGSADGGVEAVAREVSRQVGAGAADWSFGPFPESYDITYRVAFTDAVTTEVLRVVAPFDSRTESYTGPTRGDGPAEEREFGFGVLATRAAAGTATVLEVPPAPAGPRPAAAILAAEERGLAERREVRSVAGRRCQVWRTGGELAATTYLPPDPEDYIDLCIDGDGLLLEEWQVTGGRAIRQRVATSVRIGAVDPAGLAQLPRETTVPVDRGGGSVLRMEPTARPVGPFLEVGAPPEGFSLRGRYTVVPPQAGLVEGADRGKVRAATSDVYVRGVDAVVVERGGVLDLSDPWKPEERLPDVDLGPGLGTGEFVPGTLGGEVRALLGSGRYLRVYGTLDLEQLAAIARTLIPVEDGTGIGFGG